MFYNKFEPESCLVFWFQKIERLYAVPTVMTTMGVDTRKICGYLNGCVAEVFF